jgi:hypothetical protein
MSTTITTLGMVPTVLSYNFTQLDNLGNMIFSGDVINDNGSKIIDRGVVYSDTNLLPTLLDKKKSCWLGSRTKNGNGNENGTINIIIVNLIIGKTYYARTFATNAFGTSYSDVLTAIA